MLKNIKDLKVIWSNPGKFTVFLKTNDGGSGTITAETIGNDYFEFESELEIQTAQTEEFLDLLKKEKIVYKEFFEKNAGHVNYYKHDVYNLFLVYMKDNELKEVQFGEDIYNENFIKSEIEIQTVDNPLGWLDDEEKKGAEFVKIICRKTATDVKKY